MSKINFIQVTPEHLTEIVKNVISQEFEKLKSLINPSNSLINYLTREEVAKKLKISKGTLNNWVNSGKLIAHKVNRKVLFIESDIESFIANSKN